MRSYWGGNEGGVNLTIRDKLIAAANFAGAALFVWSLFDASDLLILLLIAAPVVAMAINLGARWRRTPHFEPLVPFLFLGPMAGLTVDALFMPWIGVGGLPAFAAAMAGAVVLAAFLPRGPRNQEFLTAFVLALIYFLAAGAVFARHFGDTEASGPFESKVVAKWPPTGQGQPRHEVELGPVGPHPGGAMIPVSRADFQRVALGETICLSIISGQFGMQWFASAECSPTRSRLNRPAKS